MKAFLKVFVLLNAAGFLTAIIGLLWLDWKITSTLPFLIVCLFLCFQTMAALMNQINFWRTVLLVLLGIQLICCNLYFFDVAPLHALWKYMFATLFISLIVSSYNLITIPATWFRWMKIGLMVFAIGGFLLSDRIGTAYTISFIALIAGLILLVTGFFLQPRYSTKVPKP
jgi:hypothetical protein